LHHFDIIHSFSQSVVSEKKPKQNFTLSTALEDFSAIKTSSSVFMGLLFSAYYDYDYDDVVAAAHDDVTLGNKQQRAYRKARSFPLLIKYLKNG